MYTKEELEEAVKNSTNYDEVLRWLNKAITRNSINYLKIKISKYDIDISHFKPYVSNNKNRRFNSVFRISDRRIKGTLLLSHLIKNGKEYKCELCSIKKWNGCKILEIHHKNSNPFDNTIDNLQILCPNCHTSIELKLKELNKNKIKWWQNYCECGNIKTKYAQYCQKCYHKKNPPKYKENWPNDETFCKLFEEKPATQIAKDLGVTAPTIIKKAKSLGLSNKGAGYWSKINKGLNT